MNEKEMIEIIKELAECNKDSCKDCKIICSYYSAITSFCKKVLPEGSVVLSKEEYDRLKRIELEKDRLYEIKLDLENQLIQSGLTEYIGADEIEKQACKETAKEFAKKIKEKSSQCYIARNGEKISGITYTVSEKAIDEIAKQYGVEE